MILFDLDGTLIDSTEAILESFGVAFEKCGFEKKSDDEIKKLIGFPLDKMFNNMGIPTDRVDELVSAYKEHYRKISTAKTFLLPNAKEAVIEASKIAKLGIVTTKTSRYSEILMENFGLMSYFDVLIGREDVVNPKPDPEPILKAMKFLNSKKGFMIGDTCLDIVSADRAGIIGIAVLSGYKSFEELKECRKFIEKDALSAVEFIKNSNNL